MSEPQPSRFEMLQRRYLERNLPWDLPLPPPEIVELAAALAPGRALDLGCGVGRAAIYLAAAGWQVDGVDFVPEAIAMAGERVRAAGVGDRVRLFNASVADLAFLQTPYDLAVDVGCMHALEGEDLQGYASEVARLVEPGGRYVLFAHLRERAEDAVPVSIPRAVLLGLFRETFAIERLVEGTTTVAESRWASAWIYLRRLPVPAAEGAGEA